MELSCSIVSPSSVHDAAGETLHDAYAYEPESVPSVHVRVCEVHVLPYATLDSRYAVADAPCVIVVPSSVQEGCTVSDAACVPVPPGPVAVQE